MIIGLLDYSEFARYCSVHPLEGYALVSNFRIVGVRIKKEAG
jgi:hypothetical protein